MVQEYKKKAEYSFDDLIHIMSILRGKNGCPWDKEQTYESLKQYVLEETYEVFEAINEGVPDRIAEELGDLLLQVVFYSQIASEKREFNINDVVTSVCKKMLERHTHIFGDEVAENAEQVVAKWEKGKRDKKGYESHVQVLKGIPSNLPALMRSYKVQHKASLVGFDWDKLDEAMKKVDEELMELKDACSKDDADNIKEELGDLFFALVNVSRFLKVQPELALNATIEKFIKRFEFIEKESIKKGMTLEQMNLLEMDELWEQAKVLENNK